MVRFEEMATDDATHLRLAREASSDRLVVLERGLRSERLRQLQSIPRCTSIAPFERVRDDHRLRLVHPAPLELAAPVDEFDVAQAIGSVLDGLAWLHAHGATHGAVGAMALTAGPTGGRLSLAGAFSRDDTATPADDVFAASALAFSLLVGVAAGPDSHLDPRLAQCASSAVAEAVRAGLHPDRTQRPDAALLAAMVRGEFLPPIWNADPRESRLTRLQTSVVQMLRERCGTAVGIGAALAMFVLVAALATAEQSDPVPSAVQHSMAEDPTAPTTTSAARPAAVVPVSSVAGTAESVPAQTLPPVVVLASTAVDQNDPASPIAALSPPPPPPTIAPTLIAATPTTLSPTTAPTTTLRATVAPTTRATTTTVPKKPKDEKKNDKKSKDDDDIIGGLVSLAPSLLP